jgi:AraC family transcriptional regulator, regulatory protein of adaptative response / methylated-DNA-[protein]-cysteine methyltransferase
MAGDTVAVALRASSLGTVLVGRSAHGVCAILLGDDPALLMDDLQRRFPRASLVTAGPELDRTASAVVDLIETPAAHRFDLQLDLRGTTFQRRVWQALRDIPSGWTATYGEIAQRIGAAGAARAVAGACAANPIAVAVPCHRVVRNEGGLSGYRWGVDRKRALLDRESRERPGGSSARAGRGLEPCSHRPGRPRKCSDRGLAGS